MEKYIEMAKALNMINAKLISPDLRICIFREG